MISLFGSNVGKEELLGIEDCFQRQWLGIGPKHKEFEETLSKKINSEFVFLNSGSNSLHLAIRLLNLPAGSEVILPSFTWIACANAVMLNHLVPVFCDVDYESCNVTAETISEKITKKTGAIMVVHYGGKPVDMDPILKLGIPVIEDAAHAIDSIYKGKHCGAIGTVGIFSFDAVKNLTTGEGGGVITSNPELAKKARNLRYCGIAKSGFEASAAKSRWWEYDIHDFFPKMLNTDMAAAMGIEQLKKLKSFQETRKGLWAQYDQTFETESWANDWLDLPAKTQSYEQHSYFSYFIKLKSGSRDALAKFLFDKKIYTSLRYHPLHLNPIYGKHESLPVSEDLNERGLNLPLHHRLKSTDISYILEAIKEFRQTQV